jgi:hypothetical protein
LISCSPGVGEVVSIKPLPRNRYCAAALGGCLRIKYRRVGADRSRYCEWRQGYRLPLPSSAPKVCNGSDPEAPALRRNVGFRYCVA